MKKLPILLCCLIIAGSCGFAQSKTSMDYLSDNTRTCLEGDFEK